VPPKPKRARTLRREAVRQVEQLGRDRERLFRLEPGGSAERPIEVSTPALVEARAREAACPRCGGEQEPVEHRAVVVGGARLREAVLRCRSCGTGRSLWFRLRTVN
jgi:hypothetical protein